MARNGTILVVAAAAATTCSDRVTGCSNKLAGLPYGIENNNTDKLIRAATSNDSSNNNKLVQATAALK